MKLIISFTLLLSAGVIAAQLPMGGITSVASSTPTTVIFAGHGCNWNGVSSATPTCTFGAGELTAGHAVIGVITHQTTSVTLNSVSDGGSTYTIETKYVNGSAFASEVFFTCNYAGNTQTLTLTLSGTSSSYGVAIDASGNSTSGCSDGYNKAQSTSAGTTAQSGTVTTTNAHDLVIGLATNWTGGTCTAGADKTGGTTMTIPSLGSATGVACLEYRNESVTDTYAPIMTVPNAAWNMEVLAVK